MATASETVTECRNKPKKFYYVRVSSVQAQQGWVLKREWLPNVNLTNEAFSSSTPLSRAQALEIMFAPDPPSTSTCTPFSQHRAFLTGSVAMSTQLVRQLVKVGEWEGAGDHAGGSVCD